MSSLSQTFDIQGHRGCQGLMPENTIEAFIEAIKQGVTTLELDVCISADKKVVVSHEPYMNSLFCSHPDGTPVAKNEEKELNLFTMKYTRIKKYDTGSRGNALYPEQKKIKTYKPLLVEVIKAVDKYLKTNQLPPISYNIEIKSETEEYGVSQPQVAEFSNLVYEIMAKHNILARSTLQSFDFAVLKYWHQKMEEGKYAKTKLAALIEQPEKMDVVGLLGFKPDIFSPYYKFLTKDLVAQFHSQQIMVIPWTVNDIATMKDLQHMGVDGLITDYPNRAKFLKN